MSQLPELSPEDLEKVNRLKGETTDSVPVTPEMYFYGQFGYYFGWEGLQALRKGDITLDEANKLLVSVEKVYYKKLYEQSLGNFYASKDGKTFNSGMKAFKNKTRIQE